MDCNENNLKTLTRNKWRASLVPAAAVIPAPLAYIKVVAVKKLVVELLIVASVGIYIALVAVIRLQTFTSLTGLSKGAGILL
jgi:hypothetical protein